MLRGDKVGLRARYESDVPVLQSELYDDVATRTKADSRPWRPVAPGSAASPYLVGDPADDLACFSVVRLADDQLAGEALLWGIDLHNRTAHLGVSLRPAFRGLGLGTDVVRVLCHYGFAVRGLHRLQIETLAGNAAMIRAATRVGFTREGTLRRTAWVVGDFADEAILGLLADEPGGRVFTAPVSAGSSAPGWSAPGADQPGLVGEDDGLDPVPQAQLAEHPADGGLEQV